MKADYQIRAVQLDLARQPETVEFIKDFIDFIEASHFNTLFLYLEWRVRTRTFDIGDSGYTAAQLTEIIDYAGARGIDVIPGLAALGHAELILELPEYQDYAELRDHVKGRFNRNRQDDFCPSKPGVREFIAAYFEEVNAIFKSPYIHVGGDEVWDIGFCPLCRERAADYAGEQRIYLEHFQYIHSLVGGKFGKRMMLWDDMFEYYPDILAEMPRDVVMVNWQYQSNVTSYQGHFTNLENIDMLARYERLGFEYLIAPADYHWSNVESFTNYAANRKPLGGLVTTWEKTYSFLYKSFPFIAAAGSLWGGEAGDGDAALDAGIRRIFGDADDIFRQAVRQFSGVMARVTVNAPYLNSMARSGPDHAALEAHKTLHAVLKSYSGRFEDRRAERVLQDMIDDTAVHILAARCRIACWRLRKGLEGEELSALVGELDALAAGRIALCRKYREEKFAGSFIRYFGDWRQALLDYRAAFDESGLLVCEFCLPDAYGAAYTTVEIKVGGEYREAGRGVFKGTLETLFEQCFFIPRDAEIEGVRIRVAGFAGQGVCYVAARNARGTFVPAGVTGACGIVEHPEFVLSPDITRCWLGSQRTLDAFHDRSLAELVNGIEISMKKRQD